MSAGSGDLMPRLDDRLELCLQVLSRARTLPLAWSAMGGSSVVVSRVLEGAVRPVAGGLAASNSASVRER